MPSSVNNVWASNAPTGVPENLTLPSGQTCTAIRIGMEGLISAGILTEADSLTAFVVDGPVNDARSKLQGHRKSADKEAADQNARVMQEMINNPDALRALITMADKALPAIVQNPPVALHYMNGGQPNQRSLTALERAQAKKDQPDLVFTDQVGFEDKIYLFNWAIGNLAALATFRDEPTTPVGNVADEPSVSRPTKSTPRRKR